MKLVIACGVVKCRLFSVVDSGQGLPLLSDQTEAWRADKIFFGDRPCLSKGLDDRPPSPLSQGLDPALVFWGYHPNIWPFLTFLYRISPHQLLEYKCHAFLTVSPFNIHLPSTTPSVKTTYLTILWLWFVQAMFQTTPPPPQHHPRPTGVDHGASLFAFDKAASIFVCFSFAAFIQNSSLIVGRRTRKPCHRGNGSCLPFTKIFWEIRLEGKWNTTL